MLKFSFYSVTAFFIFPANEYIHKLSVFSKILRTFMFCFSAYKNEVKFCCVFEYEKSSHWIKLIIVKMEYNIAYIERLEIPSELHGRLTGYEWNEIYREIDVRKFTCYNFNNYCEVYMIFKGAECMGTSFACAGEFCCCLFTGFFPIFCCHPCISPIFTRCTRERYDIHITTLNLSFWYLLKRLPEAQF